MIRGFIAASLDGFIAEADHGLGFLDPYAGVDAGYDAFIKPIRTLVMGRNTWAFCAGLDPWPYPGRRTIVLTSRPLDKATPHTEVWSGRLDEMIEALAEAEQDVWIVGGGGLQQAFLDRGLIGRLDLFIVPTLLGRGIPLWPGTDIRQTFRLAEVMRHGELAHLVYERL